MAGRNLGDAFIVISPDASAFLTELTAKISAAVKSYKAPAVNVPVNADTKPAEAQLTAMVTRMKTLLDQLARLQLNADDKAMQAKIAGVQARVLGLAKQMSNLVMNADTSRFDAQIAARTAELRTLEQKLSGLQMDLDTATAVRKIADLNAESVHLRAALKNMRLDVDKAAAEARLDEIAAQLAVLRSDAKTVEFEAKTSAMLAQMAALEAAIRTLKQQAADVQIGGDPAKIAAFGAQVLALEAAAERLAKAQDDAAGSTGIWATALGVLAARFGPGAQGIGWTAAIGGIAGWHIVLDAAIEATIIAVASAAALGAAFAGVYPAVDQLAYHQKAAMGVMTATGVDAGRLAGSLDKLQKSLAPQVIQAFGGALNLLGGQTSAVAKTAHEVVDMFDTWIAKLDIWANGQKTLAGFMQAGVGYLQQLGKAAAIFGQAIDNLLTKDPGVAHYLLDLIQGLAEVLNLFSKLPAPLVEAILMFHGFYLWASVLGGVLSRLTTPMVSLVTWIYNLGVAGKAAATGEMAAGLGATAVAAGEAEVAVGGAAKAMTGLREAAQATAGAEAATALGATAVAAGEAEVAVGGLAGAMSAGLGAVKGFGLGLAALAMNPLVWAAGAIALIAGIVYEMRQVPSAAKDMVGSMNASLGSASASDAIQKMITDISQLHTAISQAFSPQNIANIQATFQPAGMPTFKANLIAMGDAGSRWISSVKDVLNGNLAGAWHSLTGVVDTFSFRHDAAMHQAANAVSAYNSEITKLVGNQAGMYQTLSKLMYGQNNLNLGTLTYTQSLQLMNLAQVRAGQSTQVMLQEIANVIAGYDEMSAGGYQLQASINAVTLSTEMQDSKVTQLNQGWDAFFKLVSGGVSDFLTFAQQVNGMTEAFSGASGASTTLTISNGRVRDSIRGAATAAQGGKASMTGLNDASIAAQQTLLQTASAANTQMDALQSLAAAAGGGQHGMDLLQQATKDMLSTMLPAAQGSQQMTTVLYALAQRGGYGGANSFQALSHWIDTNSGSVKNAKPGLQDLQGIVTGLTVSAGNLATDVKNLSVALGQNLTQAEASTVIAASGASKAMGNFASSVFTSTANSKQQQAAALQLGNALVKITGNVGDAKTQFLAFAQGALHMTSQEANLLWSEVAGKLTPALQDSANKGADPARAAFEKFAGASGGTGLGLTTKQADQLWSSLKSSLTPILGDLTAKNAPAAQRAFENLAGPGGKLGLGLTKTQADALWTYLKGNLTPLLQTLTGTTVPDTQKAFEAWAGAGGKSGLGLTKAQADLLWQQTLPSLKKAIDDLPAGKNIAITMKGTGSYTVQDVANAANSAAANAGRTASPGSVAGRFAGGGYVSSGTGPTADDVPIMASRGELVVPTRLVRSGAVDHLRGAIPGFAGGGVVGASPYSGNLTPASIQGMYDDFTRQFGTAMVTAMKNAMKSAVQAAATVMSAGTPVGWSQVAGVTQWEGDVLKVLAMLGLPSSDLPTVMSQMVTESGGNPNAINLSDINAQHGDPSKGLMQVIGATFAAYRSSSLSGNIYDPMANIYAGLNYAIHRYGNPGWLGVLGHGHGYAAGGLVSSLFPAWPAPSGSWQPGPWWGELLTKQGTETAAYARDVSGLRAAAAKPGSWAHAHQAGIAGEMATLASRQAAETAAYKALGAPGAVPVTAALRHLATVLRAEGTTIRDQDLATAQPALASALYRSLGQLAQTAGTTIAPSASAGITPWPGGAGYEPPGAPAGPPLPPMPAGTPALPAAAGDTLKLTYQQLHALNRSELTAFDRQQLHLWHELHLEHLAHLRAMQGHAAGALIGGAGVTQREGMLSSILPTKWFDAGGQLGPGYTLAYNGTGRSETVTPAGGGGITAGEAAILAELRALRSATAQQGAVFGRVLNGTMTRGYYGR